MAEIKLKAGQSVDSALRALRKKLDREGTLQLYRDRRHYEKPSEKRQKQKKKARFEAMLEANRNKRWNDG
jgi:small subunit ribosomal protein S21